jgi:hypothetical protein
LSLDKVDHLLERIHSTPIEHFDLQILDLILNFTKVTVKTGVCLSYSKFSSFSTELFSIHCHLVGKKILWIGIALEIDTRQLPSFWSHRKESFRTSRCITLYPRMSITKVDFFEIIYLL